MKLIFIFLLTSKYVFEHPLNFDHIELRVVALLSDPNKNFQMAELVLHKLKRYHYSYRIEHYFYQYCLMMKMLDYFDHLDKVILFRFQQCLALGHKVVSVENIPILVSLDNLYPFFVNKHPN